MDTFDPNSMCDASEAADAGDEQPAVRKTKRMKRVVSDDEEEAPAKAEKAEKKQVPAKKTEAAKKKKKQAEDADEEGEEGEEGAADEGNEDEDVSATVSALAEESPGDDTTAKKAKRKRVESKAKSKADKKAKKKTTATATTKKKKARGEDGEEDDGEEDEEAGDENEDADDDDAEDGADGEEEDDKGKDEEEVATKSKKEEGDDETTKKAAAAATKQDEIPKDAPLIRPPVNAGEEKFRKEAFTFYDEKFLHGDRPAAVEGEVVFLRNIGVFVRTTKAGVFPHGCLPAKDLTKQRYNKLLKSGNATADRSRMGEIDKRDYIPELTGRHLMHGIVLKNLGTKTTSELLTATCDEMKRYQAHEAVCRFRKAIAEIEKLAKADPKAESWTTQNGDKVNLKKLEELRKKVAERALKITPFVKENEPNQWEKWCKDHKLLPEVFSKTFNDKKTGDTSVVMLNDYLGHPVLNEISFIGCVDYWVDAGKLLSERYYYSIKPKEAETLHELHLAQFKAQVDVKDVATGKTVQKTVTLLSEVGTAEAAWSTANRHPLGSDVRKKFGIALDVWEACPYRFVPEVLAAKRCENKTRNRVSQAKAACGYALDPANPGHLLPPPEPKKKKEKEKETPSTSSSKKKEKTEEKEAKAKPASTAKAKAKSSSEAEKKKKQATSEKKDKTAASPPDDTASASRKRADDVIAELRAYLSVQFASLKGQVSEVADQVDTLTTHVKSQVATNNSVTGLWKVMELELAKIRNVAAPTKVAPPAPPSSPAIRPDESVDARVAAEILAQVGVVGGGEKAKKVLKRPPASAAARQKKKKEATVSQDTHVDTNGVERKQADYAVDLKVNDDQKGVNLDKFKLADTAAKKQDGASEKEPVKSNGVIPHEEDGKAKKPRVAESDEDAVMAAVPQAEKPKTTPVATTTSDAVIVIPSSPVNVPAPSLPNPPLPPPPSQPVAVAKPVPVAASAAVEPSDEFSEVS